MKSGKEKKTLSNLHY